MLKDIFKKLDTWIDSENQMMIRVIDFLNCAKNIK